MSDIDIQRQIRALEEQFDRLRTVDAAMGGEGTSFPGSPASGDLFFRTDLGWQCYYDGTRWLTTNEFVFSQIYNAYTVAPSDIYLYTLRQDYAPYVSRIAVSTRVATTNSGTQYWTFTCRGYSLSFGASTVVHSFTTAADTVNVYTLHDTSTMSGTATPTNKNYLSFTITKTLSPGQLEILGSIYYRLIVT